MARRKSVQIKLKIHPSGYYRLGVGKVVGKDGKITPKRWYLRPDSNPAATAELIRQAWKAAKAEGCKVWNEWSGYAQLSNDGQLSTAGPSKGHPATIAEAAALYLSTLEARWKAGQVAQSHYDSQRTRLDWAIKTIRLMPLSLLNVPQITQAVLSICARPVVKRLNGQEKPMSMPYCKACLKTLQWFLNWLGEAGYWQPPKGLVKIFKQNQPILTETETLDRLEGVNPEPEYFTLNELCRLWAALQTGWQKAAFLLALNCGFGTSEVATFRWPELKALKGTDSKPVMYIERLRRKTMKRSPEGAFARWKLWDETAQALRDYGQIDRPDRLVLETEDGNPLAHPVISRNGKGYTQSATAQAWRHVLDRSSIDHRKPFNTLRKTAAHFVRLSDGKDVADMLLSHADTGMIKHYAGRPWDALAGATDNLRTLLAPMFTTKQNIRTPKNVQGGMTLPEAYAFMRKYPREFPINEKGIPAPKTAVS